MHWINASYTPNSSPIPLRASQIASAGGPYGRRPRVLAVFAVKYLLAVVIEELDDGVVV